MKISEENFNKVYEDENALMNCCSFFYVKMQQRVIEKMEEGKTGWTKEENKEEYKHKILNDTEEMFSHDVNSEERLIDVAIWAMFLWNMIDEEKKENV